MCRLIIDLYVVLFFFFKQKTAYEMRISDWSSDVCSSDLVAPTSSPSAHASGLRVRGATDLPDATAKLIRQLRRRCDQCVRQRLERGTFERAADADRDQRMAELAARPPHRHGQHSDAGNVIALVDRITLLARLRDRSEEHTSELQSLMRISYA